MVFSKADSIFPASIKTDIITSIIESVARLVCGAVFIFEANNRAAALHKIVGVPSEFPRRTLALCHVIIGHTHSTRATAC